MRRTYNSKVAVLISTKEISNLIIKISKDLKL